jgi:hypothetical protein
MTIAAAIEIAAGATPGPGLGKTPGAAHGSGLTGAAAQWFMASTASGAESFGEKWQSLLASLNSSNTDTDEAEANHKTLIDRSAPEMSSEKSSVATLLAGLAAGSRLYQGQGNEHISAEMSTGKILPASGVRTQALVAEPDAGAAKSVTAKTEEKKPVAAPKTESALNSHRVRPINATNEDTLPAEALPGVVPAVTANLLQAAPVVVHVSPVVQSTDESAPPVKTDISAALSTNQPVTSASASFDPQPIERNVTEDIAKAVNPAVQQIAEVDQSPAKPTQASPGPILSGSSSPTLSETEAKVATQDAPLPTAMLAEAKNLRDPQVPAPNLNQTAAQDASSAEARALSLATSPVFVPQQIRTQASLSSQAAEPNQNPAEIPATCQATLPMFVPSQSQTHSVASGPNPIQIASPNLNPKQALVANQYRTPTLVQNYEQVPAQPGNQNVNVVGAPVTGDSLNPMPEVATAQSGQLTPIPLVLGKPVSTAVGKTLTTESIRGNGNSLQQVSHLIAGQSTVPAVDSIAMARSLSGAAGTVSAVSEPGRASSFASAQQDTRETFATLDTAVAPNATTWIHVSTQRAEAGYQDPALGWVSVRANLSGGGVHAQLVPDSADAAQALSSHLAGLNAYLVEHHTPVETLSLTAPESGWSGLGSGQGAKEGMQQGSGQQTSQGADTSLSSASNPESVIQSPAPSLEPPAFFGDMDGSVQAATRGGFHISVMA